MKIKQELPQFKNQSTLIITTGKQHAVLYLAKNGEINKKAEIIIEPKSYGEKEGRFDRRTKNLKISTGAVYEDDRKDKRIKEFIDQIDEKIKEINNFQKIYCFCPQYMKNYLLKLLTKHNKDPQILLGNYTDEHPFILLEKIKEK